MTVYIIILLYTLVKKQSGSPGRSGRRCVCEAARIFRERARRSLGACPNYYAGNNIVVKVELAEPGGKGVNLPFCRLL
jgi:hypothetical protein